MQKNGKIPIYTTFMSVYEVNKCQGLAHVKEVGYNFRSVDYYIDLRRLRSVLLHTL